MPERGVGGVFRGADRGAGWSFEPRVFSRGWAGEQSPIHVDRPGDYLDDDVPGKMDCIDHAQTTTRMLQMLERRGLLRFHVVDDVHRRVRWLVAQHFSAVIREKDDEVPEAGARFVVDTWFGEHGDPAVVLPLEDWLDGEGPNVS